MTGMAFSNSQVRNSFDHATGHGFADGDHVSGGLARHGKRPSLLHDTPHPTRPIGPSRLARPIE